MKNAAFFALISLTMLTPILFGQTTGPIVEDARKHFVMGTALFKDAKTAADYEQVVYEFKRAAEIAPQWPDARYNLGLAEEAEGKYLDAIADLKLYQKFKLSDIDARTVQDKIYEVEAKAEKAKKKVSEEGDILMRKLNGHVFSGDSSVIYFLTKPIQQPGEARYREDSDTGLWLQQSHIQNGKEFFSFPIEVEPTGGLTFNEENIMNGRFTLSDDGQTLTESFSQTFGPKPVRVYKRVR